MELKGSKIGFAITGSFCTLDKILAEMKKLCDMGADVFPIFSDTIRTTDTRFFRAKDFRTCVEDITGKEIIDSITKAEPIGPKAYLDVLTVAPCTGNTIAKIVSGITDTPVLMAVKAHVRNARPVVISISTNDALAANFKNIGYLMNTKYFYFVPFGQDDCSKKPNSLIAKVPMLSETIIAAAEGKQIQPVLIAHSGS